MPNQEYDVHSDPDSSPNKIGPSAQQPGGMSTVSKALAVIAWVILLAIVGIRFGASFVVEPVESEEETLLDHQISQEMFFLGKILVAGTELSPESASLFAQQLPPIEDVAGDNRYAYVILRGELEGPEVALETIDLFTTMPQEDESEGSESPALNEDLIASLRALFHDQQAGEFTFPSLTDQQQQELKAEFGWFGELALLPRGTPNQTERSDFVDKIILIPIVAGIVLCIMGACLLAGIAVLVILLVRALIEQCYHGFTVRGEHGGVYIETFVLWFLVFLGLAFVPAWLENWGWVESTGGLLLTLVVSFIGLGVLIWPVLRGVPWSQVREDLGLHTGRGLFQEFFCWGPVSYCLALPIAAIGFGVMMLLMWVQSKMTPDAPPPTHPVQEMISSGGWLKTALVLVLGVVAAPVVEEIMFRGVLYRHLRELSGRWKCWLSVLASSLFSGFLFAAIHPQGWVAIPALMGLAVGFCLAREWRGTLLPGIFAHGFSNLLVLSLNIVLLGPS